MERDLIFAKIIENSIDNSFEAKRDLTALLSTLRDKDPEAANSLESLVKELLISNDQALALLNEIKNDSLTPGAKKFGPVLATDQVAIERLALFTDIGSSQRPDFEENVVEFVEKSVELSPNDLLSIFKVAERVQELLGETTVGRRWRRNVLPALLQKMLEQPALLTDFTVAASGGLTIPSGWEDIERWVSDWDDFRNKVPSVNFGVDGFFEVQVNRPDSYLPAAINPLELHILRRKFINTLNSGEDQTIIRAFSLWLVDHVFDGSELIIGIPIECVFAAGAFILALAVNQGVTVSENGQISATGTSSFWEDLLERIFKTFVANSEISKSVPLHWQGQQARIRDLIDLCPDWHTAPIILNLRNRAEQRFVQNFQSLEAVIPIQGNRLSVEQFSQAAEFIVNSSLPELRPSHPISSTAAFERNNYSARLENIVNAISSLEEETQPVVKDISQKAHAARRKLEAQLISPLTETAFPSLALMNLEEPGSRNLPLVTYIRNRMATLDLGTQIIRDGNDIDETLPNWGAWIDTINKQVTDSNRLQSWANLEIWDELRGRLTSIDASSRDFKISKRIRESLPWLINGNSIQPPANVKINSIRPHVAAIAHLGVEVEVSFINELETVLASGTLTGALQSLLAAMRLEIGLTAISQRTVPSNAFSQFTDLENPITGLNNQFVGWIKDALESNMAWESRAGINALILLARLAAETGDLFINAALQGSINSVEIAKKILAETISNFISGNSSSPISGLPLTLAAYDLMRYARQAAQTVSPDIIKEPVWLEDSLIPNNLKTGKKLIDALVNRLLSEKRNSFKDFVAEGGIGTKVFLLVVLQIKLNQLQLERQLTVSPLRSKPRSNVEAQFKHNSLLTEIRGLQETVRSIFCEEQLLLHGLPPAVETILITGPIQIGDIWEISFNSQNITFTATGTTTNNVIAGLAFAWNSLDISKVNDIKASESTPGVDIELDPFEDNLDAQITGFLDLTGHFGANYSLEVSTNSAQGKIKRVPASSDLVPWWQTRYWSHLRTQDVDIYHNNGQTIIPFDMGLQTKLDEGVLPDTLRSALALGNQLQILVKVQRSGEKWFILAQSLNLGQSSQTFLIQRSKINPAVFTLHQSILPPMNLLNWAVSYRSDVETSLLNLAATLESSIPIADDEKGQDVNGHVVGTDIDGRFEGEFPDLSWKATRDRLKSSINTLKEIENKYSDALNEQLEGNRTEEIINLLKEPLLVNTADYQEQMQAAIAEVRAAEVELEVAEFESLATEFEVFASELIYEAAQVEVERQSALEEVSKLDEDIAELNTTVIEIDQQLADGIIEQKERDVLIALNKIEQAYKRSEQAKRARTSILGEIKLLRQLLGIPGPGDSADTYEVTIPLPDGSTEIANGQIAAMAIKIENTVIKQLNDDLAKAEAALRTAKDKERERKKKAKRRRLVKGICRFVGAVVGTIFGGPAGAALGAEIGGAVGELANGIIDNKPPEEILVGLIDNGFAIAQASGVDLEQEINLLGAKAASEINDFFGKLDSSLETILDDFPNIIDDQLLLDTLEILDLEEVPELVDLLEKSYKELKQDVNNLDSIGTELKIILKNAGTTEPIGFGDSRELLRRLTDKLFKNTQNNVNQIETLGRAIGEEIEDLSTSEKQREVAFRIAEKFGKLVVTQIGQETSAYRREAIAQWIHFKRKNSSAGNAIWNDVVQREAELLVKELFPDGKTQSEVIANMESSLIDPKLLRGKIQIMLADWQQELDTRLSQIISIDQNAPKPSTAVQAAQASVNHLRKAIEKFSNSLLPWLKGENNEQRTQLMLDLNEKLKDDLDATSNIEVLEIDEVNAGFSEQNAQAALQMAEDELERVSRLFEIVEIQETQSVMQTKVVKLAKIRESNIAAAKGNSSKAAIERNNAAKARVKARRFNLESREALSEATVRRGAEASRIRSAFSQPPLVFPDPSAETSARLRIQHAQALERAFKVYRELLRYYQAAGVKISNEIRRPDDSPFSTWSQTLEDWLEEIGNEFQDRSSGLVGPVPITWELTPEQISSLFTPEGFRVIIGPQANESPLLFTAINELKAYLESNTIVNSPWISKFIQNGIQISSDVIAKPEGVSKFTITDNQTNSVPIVFFNEDLSDEKWQVPGEKKTYSVEVTSSELNIKRRQEPIAIGRSPYSNRYQDLIDGNQAQTGRIACVILDAVISGTTQKISESDYTIKVKHLGDRWLNQQNIKLHRVRELHEQRAFWLDSGESIDDAWKKIREFATSEGDPEPFSVQGFPVSGTLMIRLDPKSERQFDKVTLTILYKHFSS